MTMSSLCAIDMDFDESFLQNESNSFILLSPSIFYQHSHGQVFVLFYTDPYGITSIFLNNYFKVFILNQYFHDWHKFNCSRGV